jgi:hypothetical protein
MNAVATNTTTELETAIAELQEMSAALDGEVGGEFANGALAWLAAVERVQRLTKTWDSVKTPPEQLAEALHARLQGVTDVLGIFASRGSRPRSFSDFAKRATSRALKSIDGKVG